MKIKMCGGSDRMVREGIPRTSASCSEILSTTRCERLRRLFVSPFDANLLPCQDDCACICANDPSVVRIEEEPRMVHTVNNKTSMKVPKEQTVYDKFVVDDLVYDPATQNWTTATDKASEMLEQLIENEDVECMNVQCNVDRTGRQIEATSNHTWISRKELFGKTSCNREDPKAMLDDYKTSFEYFHVYAPQKAQAEFKRCLSDIDKKMVMTCSWSLGSEV